MSYINRIIEKRISLFLKIFGGISIEGPRGCGKSTTALFFAKSSFFVHENINRIEEIKKDTGIFINGETPRLIDEWQLLPSIWDSLRFEIDKRQLKGQFILSGSQTPTYNADRHTGALRIGNIKMNTMNAFETGISSCEVKFTDLFDKNKVINGEKIFSEDECLDFIIKGGWPYNISLTSYESSIALHSYINSIAYEDIKKITKQPDKERTKALISSLARNIASTVSHEVLATDSQIINSPKTIRKYLDFLEKIYLIEEVSVWKLHIRSSVQTKTNPKLYFCDPSIACASLILSPEKIKDDRRYFGQLFENFVYKELKPFLQVNDCEIYYYRDNVGLEMDFIVERNDGYWMAFEVKLGSKEGIESALKNFKSFKNKIKLEKLEKLLSFNIIVMSSKSYTIEKGINVISIFHLY